MPEQLSLKMLRRLHDGENHHAIECLENTKPRRDRNGYANYFPLRSKAHFLRYEDDC